MAIFATFWSVYVSQKLVYDSSDIQKVHEGSIEPVRTIIPPFSMLLVYGDLAHVTGGFQQGVGRVSLRCHMYFIREEVFSYSTYFKNVFNPNFHIDRKYTIEENYST